MPGVYISYPFCSQKCTFCNFASGVFGEEAAERYRTVLRNEVRQHRWDWEPETLYLGGGTPSLMPVNFLGEVLDAIPSARLTESTIECAPGTLTGENVERWVQLGFNRVSLGVQSFDETELRHTGRRHGAKRH